ncbi:MAG: ubiquinol-cytochrome C chaperone family protein [Rhodospirillaceae bacterium]
MNLFRKGRERAQAAALYGAIVGQARQPHFYLALEVADTEDGRFDMILVHMFLVLERLTPEPPPFDRIVQALFDRFFEDLDNTLREKSIGDTGVKIRIQKMVEAFYGRMAAYRKAAADHRPEIALAAALRTNLYRNRTPSDAAVTRMSAYVLDQLSQFRECQASAFLAGDAPFTRPWEGQAP